MQGMHDSNLDTSQLLSLERCCHPYPCPSLALTLQHTNNTKFIYWKNMVRRKCCYPHFLFHKKCLGMFEKQSWQEIFHYERVSVSLTAQKNTFSSELWQRQGSCWVCSKPWPFCCRAQAGCKGQDGLGAEPMLGSVLLQAELQGLPLSRARGRMAVPPVPPGLGLLLARGQGTLTALFSTQPQGVSTTVLWPIRRNVAVWGINHITGGMFSHSKA